MVVLDFKLEVPAERQGRPHPSCLNFLASFIIEHLHFVFHIALFLVTSFSSQEPLLITRLANQDRDLRRDQQ